MPETELTRLIILLLLSNKGEKDSQYSMIRLMNWRFDIWDFVTAMDDVVAEGLVVRGKEGRLDVYKMTDKGRLFLEDHVEGLQQRLIAEFPAQKEFIDLLF